MDNAEYCKQLETYLCRKNGGHLIRIVGPAFERVCAWSEQGIPLKVACRGIDRYCERQQAAALSGRRRRPVRIEFCEADIMTVFDDWRRAVGVVRETGPETAAPAPKQPPLVLHLERVVARLIGRRTAGSERLERHVAGLLADLDQLSAQARQARGEARAAILDRLAALDDELLAAAREEIEPRASAALRREAEQELDAMGARMTADVRSHAVDAAFHRLLRESLGLPTVRYG